MVAEKYIKLDVLTNTFAGQSPESYFEKIFSLSDIDKILDEVSVVDAVEVACGIWTDNGKNIYGQNLTQCSICHSNSIEGGRFCRCCGALMKN